MNSINGIGTPGTTKVQGTVSSPVDNGEKGVGHIGSHSVKVGTPDASLCERAIASFLALSDELGRSIQAKISGSGPAHGSLSLTSSLSEKVNRRASEWIDTMSTLAQQGVSVEDLDKMSHEVVSELKSLIGRTISTKAKEGVESAPVSRTPVETMPPLKEASSAHRANAAAALSRSLGRPILPEKTHVYKNIGGGSCFFHSVMQLLAKSDPARHPVGNTTGSANRLREALINHVRDLKARMERGETHGLKAVAVEIDGKKVTTVSAKTSERTELEHMHPITEGFDLALDPKFAQYGTMADVATAALLADYLQRPVVVVAQTGDGSKPGSVNTMEFKYGLGSGQKLAGEPLVIYYDQSNMHFMAVDVEK